MTLVETGTRALLGAVFDATATGEIAWAGKRCTPGTARCSPARSH